MSEAGAIFFHTLTDVVGLIGNALLIYLALRKTPKSIRTYSILIINFGITDFCCSLTALFVEQRLIPIGMSLAYISSGPCRFFGPMVCYVGYSAMLHFYAHSLWSLFLSFLYRFYVLRYKAPKGQSLVFALILFYSLSFIQFVSFNFASDPPEIMAQIIKKNFPDYEIEGKTISGTVNILHWNALFTILHMTLPVTPVYIVIIFVRRSIIETLDEHSMSDSTKAIHSQLLKALTFQALLPALYFLAVVSYALGQFGIFNHPILEYSTFIVVGFLPCISPLGSLYFIRPYKHWIQRHILRKPQRVHMLTGAHTRSVFSTGQSIRVCLVTALTRLFVMMVADMGAVVLHTVTNSVGLLANALLIGLVLTITPKSIRTYSILILNFGITDFCGCLMGLFVQQRLVPVGLAVTYISNGPCTIFGSSACYLGYAVLLHCYSHSLYSLLISFLYRFVVLQSKTPTISQVVLVVLGFYSLSVFQLIVFSMASGPPEQIKKIIHDEFPAYNLENQTISGNPSVLEWKTMFTALHMTLPVTPVYVTIIYIRRAIIKTLTVHNMSENTKNMHRQLLTALTFQATLPGLYSISVLSYVIGQTGIYNHPALEYTTFLVMGMLPVISPFGTLYFIKPYKNWVIRYILRRSVVDPKNIYTATVFNTSQVLNSNSESGLRKDFRA